MYSKPFTSDQFEKLLSALGYQLVPSNGPQRVYENRQFDAIKILPPAGKEPYARIEHLMTLRTVSIAKGIVDEETFERLLKEVSENRTSTAMRLKCRYSEPMVVTTIC